MGRRAVAPPQRPGYEPAKGFPDPQAPPPPTYPAIGYYTHEPHSNGAACGVYPPPNDAKFYDPVAPTCPKCAAYLAAKQAVTRARHPEAFAPPAAPVENEDEDAELVAALDKSDTDPPPATPRDRK